MPRPPRRSLRTLLLVNLGLFTASAVMLVGLSTVVFTGGDLSTALTAIVALWIWSTVVALGFGWVLVQRVVMRPVRELAAEVQALAEPEAEVPETHYETLEFAALSESFRTMAAARTEAERAALRAEKLASIGQLAAGVAHEVRNPLGALSTYVDVMAQRGRDRDVTDPMRGAIARIERIVQGLLTYARPAAAVGAVDLVAVVESAVALVRGQPPFSARTLEVAVARDLAPVRGSTHALEQVIVNLLTNAAQASPDGPITVLAQQHEVGASLAPSQVRTGEQGTPPSIRRGKVREPRRRELPAGTQGALLIVSDRGPGVPPEDRDRIFDAFFTTKEPGQGTGLGLAIVASTVEEAGGVVWVDEARGGGAAFKIFLPFAGRAHAVAHR